MVRPQSYRSLMWSSRRAISDFFRCHTIQALILRSDRHVVWDFLGAWTVEVFVIKVFAVSLCQVFRLSRNLSLLLSARNVLLPECLWGVIVIWVFPLNAWMVLQSKSWVCQVRSTHLATHTNFYWLLFLLCHFNRCLAGALGQRLDPSWCWWVLTSE